MSRKPTVQQLAADLEIAHLALREITEVLGQRDRFSADSDPLENNIHFNIGKVWGIATRGLSESGHGTRNPKALNYVERSNLAVGVEGGR